MKKEIDDSSNIHFAEEKPQNPQPEEKGTKYDTIFEDKKENGSQEGPNESTRQDAREEGDSWGKRSASKQL